MIAIADPTSMIGCTSRRAARHGHTVARLIHHRFGIRVAAAPVLAMISEAYVVEVRCSSTSTPSSISAFLVRLPRFRNAYTRTTPRARSTLPVDVAVDCRRFILAVAVMTGDENVSAPGEVAEVVCPEN